MMEQKRTPEKPVILHQYRRVGNRYYKLIPIVGAEHTSKWVPCPAKLIEKHQGRDFLNALNDN